MSDVKQIKMLLESLDNVSKPEVVSEQPVSMWQKLKTGLKGVHAKELGRMGLGKNLAATVDAEKAYHTELTKEYQTFQQFVTKQGRNVSTATLADFLNYAKIQKISPKQLKSLTTVTAANANTVANKKQINDFIKDLVAEKAKGEQPKSNVTYADMHDWVEQNWPHLTDQQKSQFKAEIS